MPDADGAQMGHHHKSTARGPAEEGKASPRSLDVSVRATPDDLQVLRKYTGKMFWGDSAPTGVTDDMDRILTAANLKLLPTLVRSRDGARDRTTISFQRWRASPRLQMGQARHH